MNQAELLRRHGLRLDKRLGQHFLVDGRVPDRIASEVAALGPERVVELASGAGALSFALLGRGWPVTALELDRRMIDLLREETAGRPIEILERDLAVTDFTEFVDERAVVFAGNLPYQVTSPVLFGLLPALALPSVRGAVVMVQAEVGRRIAAAPGGRTYGILSVLLQARLEVRRAFRVRPGAFLPPPEVDSEVLVLTPRTAPVPLDPAATELVRTLFGERRKQIGGMLRRHFSIGESDLGGLESATGLAPSRRPETLRPEDFLALSDWLRARGGRI